MKTAKDPRHQRRRQIVRELFASSFTNQKDISEASLFIFKNTDKFDEEIQKAASAWPIDKLNKADLAILRLAVYELELGEAPEKVIIDEAVELAKEFGGENSPSFVNGVLGTILKNQNAGKNS